MSQNRFLAFVLVFCSLAWWSSQARAQTDFGQRIWWKSDHNSMSAEVNRVLGIPSATYPAAGTPNVNGAHFTNASGQWPVANAKTNLPFPGKSAPIDVVAKVKPASVGAAFGRLAQKVGPLANAVALVTFAAEVGFILTDNPAGGAPLVAKTDSNATPSSGTYWLASNGATQGRAWTAPGACKIVISTLGGVYTGYLPGESRCTGTKGGFPLGANVGPDPAGNPYPCPAGQYPGTSSCSLTPPSVSSSSSELADFIAAQSGWPSNSHIREALAEAIKNGETIEYDPAQVSGPASRPGTSSTTTAPDGTVTTINVTNNYSYTGPKVTVTSTTTTTTTAPGGSPVTTIRTDTDPAPEASPEEDTGTPTDTALPAQPELYTPEYPEGLKGVWNAKKAELEGLPILDLLDDMMPNVAGSGSCPSWTIDMDMYIVDYGSHVIAIPCWVWDFGKVVIICSALLLSRRLIFGG